MATENERVPLFTGGSQPSASMGGVFLRYASEDAGAAERIATALRNEGIEVWFDQSELRGGDVWDQTIRKQIKACSLFIPLISRHTHERREGYFRLECELAVDRSNLISATQAFIVPVVIDDTREDDEEVPERIRDAHWTRLPGGDTTSAFIERVRRLLSPDAPTARGAAVTPPSRFTTAETPRKPVPAYWWSKPAVWTMGAAHPVRLGSVRASGPCWRAGRALGGVAHT